MALVVQKYGGSSVSDIEAMRRVARRVVATREAGNTVVVVVSAMGDTTDDLLDMAGALTGHAPAREMDILLSAGERISMALLAMAIHAEGSQAEGTQAEGTHSDAAHTEQIPSDDAGDRTFDTGSFQAVRWDKGGDENVRRGRRRQDEGRTGSVSVAELLAANKKDRKH